MDDNTDAFIPPSLHDLEAEVMTEVWRQGEATVRAVMERLNADASKQRAYTTYMTVMSRLYAKGLLRRRREGKTDIYVPRLSEEEYREQRARVEVGDVVDQYGEAALVHFARHMAGMDPRTRSKLQRLARRG